MTGIDGAPRLQLVGGMQVKGAEWDLDSCANLFGRMTTEVKHTSDMTRFVGYASEKEDVRFLGIEVERITDIPVGMVAWDLRGDTCTVLEAEAGGSIVHQAEVNWNWLDQPASGRIVGEFSSSCPSEWCCSGTPECHDFQLTANAYIELNTQACDDGVYLADYDASWPQQFTEMACWLQTKLGPDVALRIEHYGSTAIPGMLAKPVIDILVEVPSFMEARQRAIPLFNHPDWEYWWYSGHMTFAKRREFMGVRTHHIHMAPAGHVVWKALAFRDYLRSHPEEAAHYAALKQGLAASYPHDRERYTVAKGEYVRGVTEKALGSETR